MRRGKSLKINSNDVTSYSNFMGPPKESCGDPDMIEVARECGGNEPPMPCPPIMAAAALTEWHEPWMDSE